MRQIQMSEIRFKIEVLPEETMPDWWDKQEMLEILKEAEWNVWAWCVVVVHGHWHGLHDTDVLGGCSYKSEDSFKAGGYYADMKEEVRERIQMRAERIARAMQIELDDKYQLCDTVIGNQAVAGTGEEVRDGGQ